MLPKSQLISLSAVPGMGPRRIRALFRKFPTINPWACSYWSTVYSNEKGYTGSTFHSPFAGIKKPGSTASWKIIYKICLINFLYVICLIMRVYCKTVNSQPWKLHYVTRMIEKVIVNLNRGKSFQFRDEHLKFYTNSKESTNKWLF